MKSILDTKFCDEGIDDIRERCTLVSLLRQQIGRQASFAFQPHHSKSRGVVVVSVFRLLYSCFQVLCFESSVSSVRTSSTGPSPVEHEAANARS